MRVLGVDFGLRRLGLALSDPRALIASPLRTLTITTVREAPGAVAEVAREVGAEMIVVGIPEGLEGEEDRPEALRVRRFARALRREHGLTVHIADESLSTREAEEGARAQGRSDRGEELHAAAAAVILQRWLDERARRQGGGAA